MSSNRSVFGRLRGFQFGALQTTIGQIKAMEAGMYLTYTFPDMPDGLFFLHQRDLVGLIERYERYEKALLEILTLDECQVSCRALVTKALGEVLCDETEEEFEKYDDLLEIANDDSLDFADGLIQDFSEDGPESEPS